MNEKTKVSESPFEIRMLDPSSQVCDYIIQGNTGPLVDFLNREKVLSDLLAYLEKVAGNFTTYGEAVSAILTENADYDKVFLFHLWRIGVAVCDVLQEGYKSSPDAFHAFLKTENAMPTVYRLPFTKAKLDQMRKQAKAIGLGENLNLKDRSKTQFKASYGVNYPAIALDVYRNLTRRYYFDLNSREKCKGWKGKMPVASRDPSGKVKIIRIKTKLLCQLHPLSLRTLKEWRGILKEEFTKFKPPPPYWQQLRDKTDRVDYLRDQYQDQKHLEWCMQSLRGLLARK